MKAAPPSSQQPTTITTTMGKKRSSSFRFDDDESYVNLINENRNSWNLKDSEYGIPIDILFLNNSHEESTVKVYDGIDCCVSTNDNNGYTSDDDTSYFDETSSNTNDDDYYDGSTITTTTSSSTFDDFQDMSERIFEDLDMFLLELQTVESLGNQQQNNAKRQSDYIQDAINNRQNEEKNRRSLVSKFLDGITGGKLSNC